MLRMIKYLSLIAFFTIMILIGVVIVLIRSFDPNQYKAEINSMLTEMLGQPVAVEGALNWAVYPRISLEAHNINIKSNNRLKDPLALKTILINCRFFPLLHGNIEVTTINLRDLELNYITDKQGVSNWNKNKTAKKTTTKNHKQEDGGLPGKKHRYSIENITIQNAKIRYDNQQTGQHVLINNLKYTGNVNVDSLRDKVNFATDVTLDGHLVISAMELNKIHINDLTAVFKGNKGIYELSPINAKFYDGQSISNCRFDLRGKPQMMIKETFKDINVNRLFADLGYQKRIHGILKGSLDLNSNNLQTLPASLNGKASIEFNDGSLKGIDILHAIDIANALFHRRSPPEHSGKNETPFKSMSGDIFIHHGDILNENFKLISPALLVTGKGHIDLNHWQLEYRLNAQAQGVKDKTKLAQAQAFLGGGFPLIAKGQIDSYKITPDIKKIATKAAKYFITREVGDKVDDLLKKGGDNIKKTLDKKPIKRLLDDILQ